MIQKNKRISENGFCWRCSTNIGSYIIPTDDKKQRGTQEMLAQKRKGYLSTGKEYQSKNLAKYLLGLNDTQWLHTCKCLLAKV